MVFYPRVLLCQCGLHWPVERLERLLVLLMLTWLPSYTALAGDIMQMF